MELFVTKNRQKLETVATASFILNVTGLLDSTLKHVDKLRSHPAFTCSNSAEKPLEAS